MPRGSTHMTGNIQLALSDAAKAAALQAVLSRSTQASVVCVEDPVMEAACVVVVDPSHLTRLPVPLSHPDRVVLIAGGDPGSIKNAWDAGVGSVVSEQDSLNTVVLAILAVCLRGGQGRPRTELDAARMPGDDAASKR